MKSYKPFEMPPGSKSISPLYYKFEQESSERDSFFFDDNELLLNYTEGTTIRINWLRYERKFFKAGSYFICLFRGDDAKKFGFMAFKYNTIDKEDISNINLSIFQGSHDIGFINFIIQKMGAKKIEANIFHLAFTKAQKRISLYDYNQLSIF